MRRLGFADKPANTITGACRKPMNQDKSKFFSSRPFAVAAAVARAVAMQTLAINKRTAERVKEAFVVTDY